MSNYLKMKRLIMNYWIFLFTYISMQAQETKLIGKVVDAQTRTPISSVSIQIMDSPFLTSSDLAGEFGFDSFKLPIGEQILLLEKQDYITKKIPIIIDEGQTLDLSIISLTLDLVAMEPRIGTIGLSDAQLHTEEGEAYTVSGLLQASKDVFLNAAAFEFSSTFFRPRGLDNSNGKILINGISMNKLFNGRPQWANWGGLNDVQRNREFSMGLKANEYSFGDLAGTSYIDMRASKYREGGRFSFAYANRSYQARMMATYNSGLGPNGWAYSLSIARRDGNQAFVEGNTYSANSFFAAVEKKINAQHSINLTAFYTPNSRGRSAAVTEEVNRLRGIRYNPNWGYQAGEMRNSRMRKVQEPIIILSHYWKIGDNTSINTNIGYQTGKVGTTRIDNGGTRLLVVEGQDTYIGGGRNPLPNYYQRMPSYFLRDENPGPYHFQLAYQAQQNFINDGQIDWGNLYRANELVVARGGNSVYVLQEDRMDDTQFSLSSILSAQLNEHFRFNANIEYQDLISENFAEINDLLGGTGYLDVDFFAEDDVNLIVGDLAQSDLQNRNRIALEGERYKYNYQLLASVVNGFVQGQFTYKSLEFYIAVQGGQTSYMRSGLYENGNFPGQRSLGDSEKLGFTTFGGKLGGVYKFTGRHLMEFNLGYFTKAPSLRNSFGNARQNNDLVIGLSQEIVESLDLSYHYRSPVVKARLSGYYNAIEDMSDVGFYFTENISGLGIEQDAFIQEVVTGIDTERLGGELGIEAQVTTTIKLKAAAAVGQYIYTNNPMLYITSDDFDSALLFGDGTAKLKNYHVAGGPEQAFHLGFEYRDPTFWWFSLSGNHFRDAYIDVNNLARTANFSSDFDGAPINDYDPNTARSLLRQEKFDSYYLLNLVGGKSWRISKYYLGFFASISNILDQAYVTGGFEQGRFANYRDMQLDQSREYGQLFGPRYFFGYGTTYYFNLYIRF